MSSQISEAQKAQTAQTVSSEALVADLVGGVSLVTMLRLVQVGPDVIKEERNQ